MVAYILMALVGAVVTLNLHELSHVLVVKLTGGQIREYVPWPHMNGGRFYFGRVRATYTGSMPRSYRWSHLAPLAKATALGTAWSFLAQYYWSPLWALAAWELIDAVWWQFGYYFRPQSDGGRWRKAKHG